MVDVEAGAFEASGRARISVLIGLLMRPCKARSHKARRITMELAYRPLFTFPPSPSSASASASSCILKRDGASAH